MRVITGTARGRKLTAPEGLEVRPTADMVKEAMFTIVAFDVPGARVLDLFAGSGQLGIEALSRGASHAVFIDHNPESIQHIKANLNATGHFSNASVANMDSLSYLRRCQDRFDLAFLDPPYGKQLIDEALPMVAGVMGENGLILCETGRDEAVPETAGDFVVKKHYRYGKKKVTVYHRAKAGEDES